MKIASVLAFIAILLLLPSCKEATTPISSDSFIRDLAKRPAHAQGMITTQVLMRVGTTDYIISNATVQLYGKNGKTLIGTLQFQQPGDPFPGYWRYYGLDSTQTYVLKCILPPEYSGRPVFSCLTSQYGVGTINEAYYTIKPTDWFWDYNFNQGGAYPRQFYIATQ
jgi:hypothetical protein